MEGNEPAGYRGELHLVAGRLTQRLECLPYKEEVGGSNPSSPTSVRRRATRSGAKPRAESRERATLRRGGGRFRPKAGAVHTPSWMRRGVAHEPRLLARSRARACSPRPERRAPSIRVSSARTQRGDSEPSRAQPSQNACTPALHSRHVHRRPRSRSSNFEVAKFSMRRIAEFTRRSRATRSNASRATPAREHRSRSNAIVAARTNGRSTLQPREMPLLSKRVRFPRASPWTHTRLRFQRRVLLARHGRGGLLEPHTRRR